MMEMHNPENISKDIVNRLKPLNPVKIILFGSYADGTQTINSDIDICIVKEKVDSRISEKRKARELLRDIHIAKDILVSSRSEYDFYKNEYGSVFMDIDKEGKLLWQNI
jgi:uncharacterized protein